MKKVFVLLLLVLSVSVFAQSVAIIGAMDSEIATLKTVMTGTTEQVIAGITFYSGKIEGKDVVLFKPGVGKVNAAVGSVIAFENFNISSIIFTGVAGSADPAINIGDIVISTHLIQHDYDTTVNGNKPGAVPVSGIIDGKFIADEKLVSLAQKAATTVLGKDKVKLGVIVTGDQFIANKEKVTWLRNTFNASATEMEGAAVAQAAFIYKKPFVVIRSMSDKADGSAHMDFSKFVVMASENSAKIVQEMLKTMGK